MKLKYYLRGIGMGILFATIVMTVSSVVHNNNLSDEIIIKEAKKLGMIMPEETKSQGSLFSTDDTEEVVETEIEDDKENDTEEVSESVSSQNTEIASSEEVESETEPVIEKIESGNVTLIRVEIYPGDAARQVAERLYAYGLVDDSERFRIYIGETGYAKILRVGEYYVPVGATYDEIISILVSK